MGADRDMALPEGFDGLEVPAEQAGERVDRCLAALLPDHSRGFYQKLLRTGDILVNGSRCRPSATVSAGDVLMVRWPEEEVYDLDAQEVAFEILHEDDEILVINKPPGLVVHPAEGNRNGTLVHGLLYHDSDTFSDLVDETMRPGIVHRLDKDTSGVMVVAKSLQARLRLKAAFKERDVEKTYLALVINEFGSRSGTIEQPIGRNPRNRLKMAVVPEGGKYALTKYRVLGTASGHSLLEVRIFTGRTHQIRVHFSHLNHPILGDGLYGGRPKNAPFMPDRQLLHAWKIVFPHPSSGVMRQYMAPLPDDFSEALEVLGLPAVGRPRPPEPEFVPPPDDADE